MNIAIKKIYPDSITPDYANDHDAGMDLYAHTRAVIEPGAQVVIPTGIAMSIPEGYVGLIWDKSGLATKHGITTLAGVIDAGYRGEIRVALLNTSAQPYTVKCGKKIAQLLVQPVVIPTIKEVSELPESKRGAQGFGSSGLNKTHKSI